MGLPVMQYGKCTHCQINYNYKRNLITLLSLKFNKHESTSSEFILTSTSPSRKTSLSSLSVPEKGSDILTGFNGTFSVCLGSCFSRTGGNGRIFTNSTWLKVVGNDLLFSTFAFSGEITLLNLFSNLVLVGDGVANWYFCLTKPKGKDLDVFISFCNSSTSFSALFIYSFNCPKALLAYTIVGNNTFMIKFPDHIRIADIFSSVTSVSFSFLLTNFFSIVSPVDVTSSCTKANPQRTHIFAL